MKEYKGDNEEFQADLRDIVTQAREFGYAVTYFTPEETSDVDKLSSLEDVMIERGWQYIEYCHVEFSDEQEAADAMASKILSDLLAPITPKMAVYEAYNGIGECVARFYAASQADAEEMGALRDGVVKVIAVPAQQALANEIMAASRENLPAKEKS